MKATIASPALFDDALSWAVLAYPARDDAPVSVIADREASEIRIVGMDHAQAHSATLPADVEESGQMWINGRAAHRLFSDLSAGRVTISAVEPAIALNIEVTPPLTGPSRSSSPTVRAALATVAPGHTNFPGPDATWTAHGSITGDLLAVTAGAAERFVERDTIHEVLAGVHLTTGPQGLTATACTDRMSGTFLAGVQLTTGDPSSPRVLVGDNFLEVVVPGAGLDRAMQGLLFTGLPVEIATARNVQTFPLGRPPKWVRFSTLGRVAHILTAPGRYAKLPPPPKPTAVAEVLTQDLYTAVERLVSRDPDLMVDVRVGEDVILLVATSSAGSAHVVVPVTCASNPASTVRVPAQLLSRGLTHLMGGVVDLIEIRTAGPYDPLVLAAVEDDSTYVQMTSVRPAGSVRGV